LREETLKLKTQKYFCELLNTLSAVEMLYDSAHYEITIDIDIDIDTTSLQRQRRWWNDKLKKATS